MTTTPTTPRRPTVPLPVGAVKADDWESRGGEMPYRIARGADRGVDGVPSTVVWTSVVQFADGTLDDGSRTEPPSVHVENPDRGLTSAQARQLARLLISAADEVDRWT
jgi:hypothetical protein